MSAKLHVQAGCRPMSELLLTNMLCSAFIFITFFFCASLFTGLVHGKGQESCGVWAAV